MTDTESKQLLQDIINKAQEGQALPFRFIRYWNEFRYYQRHVRSTKIIIKTLESSADNLFTEYCSDVTTGSSDLNKLLAYSTLLDIIEFYKQELNTMQLMIQDYDDYLGDGHFWHSFLGGRREL